MRNLFTYYVIILAPLGILFWLDNSDYISSKESLIFLMIYLLIYRTYTDGKRLADKNIISQKDIWKMIIPGNRLEHFRELYLK